jgi:SAM-dependent methyltransferase
MASRIWSFGNIRLALLLCIACLHANGSTQSPPAAVYGQITASSGGSGKVFAGREIAAVMSWHGAGWLERSERKTEERPDLLLDALNLKPGMTIADIGAGSGYYARQLAAITGPGGKVWAVDVQPEMLEIIKKQNQARGIKNIVPVLATERDVQIPEGSVDLALLVDVYHELQYPVEVMASLARAIKPGGQIALIEFRAEDKNVPIMPLHKMSEAQIKKEAALLGLTWVRTINKLPWQHVVILGK